MWPVDCAKRTQLARLAFAIGILHPRTSLRLRNVLFELRSHSSGTWQCHWAPLDFLLNVGVTVTSAAPLVNRLLGHDRIRQEDWSRDPDKMRMRCSIGQECRTLLHWLSEFNNENNKGTQLVLRIWKIKNKFEFGYDVTKRTEYFVSL